MHFSIQTNSQTKYGLVHVGRCKCLRTEFKTCRWGWPNQFCQKKKKEVKDDLIISLEQNLARSFILNAW